MPICLPSIPSGQVRRDPSCTGTEAPEAPTIPRKDPSPPAPPSPQEPAPTPTFTPSEDPGADPAPTCPEGSPDEGDGTFETCCLPSRF